MGFRKNGTNEGHRLEMLEPQEGKMYCTRSPFSCSELLASRGFNSGIAPKRPVDYAVSEASRGMLLSLHGKSFPRLAILWRDFYREVMSTRSSPTTNSSFFKQFPHGHAWLASWQGEIILAG